MKTKAAPVTPQNLWEQIGPASPLLALLICFAPMDWNAAVYVAGGNTVSDAELAERLAVSQGTIATWRRRLRAAGVIGWLVDPGKGRVFWVSSAVRIFGKPAGASTTAQMPSQESASAASRWIQ